MVTLDVVFVSLMLLLTRNATQDESVHAAMCGDTLSSIHRFDVERY